MCLIKKSGYLPSRMIAIFLSFTGDFSRQNAFYTEGSSFLNIKNKSLLSKTHLTVVPLHNTLL
jgi:hypothetical protein